MDIVVRPADDLYTKVFFRMTALWSSVLAFRRIAEVGLPKASTRLYYDNFIFAQALFEDPQNDKLFLDKQKAVESIGGAEGLGAKMTQNMTKSFRATADAASIAFVHSLLDGAAIDFCRVTALVAPDDWEPFVRDQKVTLLEAKDHDYVTLLKRRIDANIEYLERQALLKKTDRLFAVCKPEKNFTFKPAYRFDPERLASLDKLRHDLIHGEGPLKSHPAVDESLEYLFETSLFLFVMVNHRYGVRIDPTYPARAGW